MEFTKADKPVGFKKNWWVDTASETNKKGDSLVGDCEFCNRWSAELRQGLCREEDCIKGRELWALAQGQAGIAITGLPGNREVYTLKDDRRVVVNKPESVSKKETKEKLTKQQRRKANKAAKLAQEQKEKYAEYKAKADARNRAEYMLKLRTGYKTIDNKKNVTKEICELLGASEENEENVITIEENKVTNYLVVGKDKYISMSCENQEAYKTLPAIVSYDSEVYGKIEYSDKDNQALYRIDHKLQSIREKQERLHKAWKADKKDRIHE